MDAQVVQALVEQGGRPGYIDGRDLICCYGKIKRNIDARDINRARGVYIRGHVQLHLFSRCTVADSGKHPDMIAVGDPEIFAFVGKILRKGME